MDKVKALVAAGASISTAIRESLGMSILDFSEKYGRPRAVMTAVIGGLRRPTEADLSALVSELGGTREEWAELLWQAARPTNVRASA